MLATPTIAFTDPSSDEALDQVFRVGHVLSELDLTYGGPSRSVLALARAQARLAAPVALATIGTATRELWSHPGLTIAWSPRERPRRILRSSGLARFLHDQAFGTLHHHGLGERPLHYAFRAARLRGVPLVISPRGMMSGRTWQRHRRRHALASLLIHPGALTGATAWHATSEDEADEIRSLGFSQPICVASNGVEVPSREQLDLTRAYWQDQVPEARERPVAVFTSRFHSNKRVLELIDAWMAHAPKDWLLLMVGTPDQFGVRELQQHALRRGDRTQVKVFDTAHRPPPYAIASLSLLPSHSETFGLAIAESLAAGVPALVTDTTPWAELNTSQAGWCVPWARFGKVLAETLHETPEVLATRGEIGRDWVQERYSWHASARQLLDFYSSLPGHH